MKSDFYSQEIYERTLESMMIEWKAHNLAWILFRTEQFGSTDFDKESEGMEYLDYIISYIERRCFQ